MAAETPNTRFLWRLTSASQGAVEIADATTDPRPRVTKKMGNAQQTSVVTEDANPRNVLARSVCMRPPLKHTYPQSKATSDDDLDPED